MPNEKSHQIRTEEEEKFEDTKGVRNRKSKITKRSETVIEEGYTTQWLRKRIKEQTTIYKTLRIHRKL